MAPARMTTGLRRLTVTEDDSSEDRARLGAKATCLLSAEEALLLADRLQRAAHSGP